MCCEKYEASRDRKIVRRPVSLLERGKIELPTTPVCLSFVTFECCVAGKPVNPEAQRYASQHLTIEEVLSRYGACMLDTPQDFVRKKRLFNDPLLDLVERPSIKVVP